MAVNCCVALMAMLALAGVTAIDVSVALVPVSVDGPLLLTRDELQPIPARRASKGKNSKNFDDLCIGVRGPIVTPK